MSHGEQGRTSRLRRVLHVFCWALAAVLLAALVAINVAVALFGDTIEAYLGSGNVDISGEKLEATMD